MVCSVPMLADLMLSRVWKTIFRYVVYSCGAHCLLSIGKRVSNSLMRTSAFSLVDVRVMTLFFLESLGADLSIRRSRLSMVARIWNLVSCVILI